MTREEIILNLQFPDNPATFCKAVDEAILLLQKDAPKKAERLLPCACGSKQRETLYLSGRTSPNRYHLICLKCGNDVYGKTKADLHANWNTLIRQKGAGREDA